MSPTFPQRLPIACTGVAKRRGFHAPMAADRQSAQGLRLRPAHSGEHAGHGTAWTSRAMGMGLPMLIIPIVGVNIP